MITPSLYPSQHAPKTLLTHILHMSTAERALIDIAQDRRYWIIHSITILLYLLVELYLCCLALCTSYLGL